MKKKKFTKQKNYSKYMSYTYPIEKCTSAEANYLKEAMKLSSSFDGNTKQSVLSPVLFRNEITNWYSSRRMIKGFIPDHAVLVLKNAVVGEARKLLNQSNPTAIRTIKQYLAWFDEQFDVTALRGVLHDQIKNWVIDKTTPCKKVVEVFESQVKLFDQSGFMATDVLKKHTEFTEEQLVHTLTRQFYAYNPELWDEFVRQTSLSKKMPQNLTELNELVKEIAGLINDRKIMSANNDPTKIGNNHVNAIGYNSNNNNNNNNNGGYNSRNRNNYFSQNRNNNNDYGGGRGGRYRGGGGGRYRGGRTRGRGGGYQTRRNNQDYRDNRRDYNDKSYLDNRKDFMPSGNPKFFRPIPYATRRCEKCHKWGHRAWHCRFMTKYFRDIMNNYANLDRNRNDSRSFNNNNGNGNNSSKNISHKELMTLRKIVNKIDKDNSDNNSDSDGNSDGGTYKRQGS